jgi:hypothetical protein
MRHSARCNQRRRECFLKRFDRRRTVERIVRLFTSSRCAMTFVAPIRITAAVVLAIAPLGLASCSSSPAQSGSTQSAQNVCDNSTESVFGKILPDAEIALATSSAKVWVIMKARVPLPSAPNTLSDQEKLDAIASEDRFAQESQSCAVAAAANLGVTVLGSAAVPNTFEALVTHVQALALAARIDVDHIDAVGVTNLL